MIRYLPRYLLYVETSSLSTSSVVCADDCFRPERLGRWRFIVESLDDQQRLEVAEEEPGVWGARLDLLATVRGLEAFEQPSHVTLIAGSAYLNDHLNRFNSPHGAPWETSQATPWQDRYQNADLWLRLETALGYHEVEARNWRLDSAHGPGPWHLRAQQAERTGSHTVADSEQPCHSRPAISLNQSPLDPAGQLAIA